MGTFNVDPSERKKCIPAGEYVAAVIGAEIKEPSAKAKPGEEQKEKHPYIQVEFVVDEGEYKNETFTDMFSLSPKARPRLATFVTELGLAPAGHKGEMSFDTNDMIGRFCVVKGKIEEFGGMERFRPSSFKAFVTPETSAAPAPQSAAPAPAPAAGSTPPPARPAPAPAPSRPAPMPARRSV